MITRNSLIQRAPGLFFACALAFSSGILSAHPIGVMPFESADVKLGEQTAAQVLVALQKTRQFTLVERGQIKKAYDEIAKSESGLVKEEDAVKIGKMSGAHFMVVGEIRKGANDAKGQEQFTATMRIMKTETGVIIGAGSAAGPLPKVFESIGEQATRWLSIYLVLDNPDSPYSVLLKLDKGKNPTYKLGETLVLSFKVIAHKPTAAKRVYIQVYSINAQGAMMLIYPNKFSRDEMVDVGREYKFPADSDDFEWTLVKPTGTESIQAIVTTKPVDFFDLKGAHRREEFPKVKARGDAEITYRGINTKLKKEKLGDYTAEKITYELTE